VSDDYFKLKMSGAPKWYMPTFNKSYENLNPDQPNPRKSIDPINHDGGDPAGQTPWDGTAADKGNMPRNSDVEAGLYVLTGSAVEAADGYWKEGDTKAGRELIWDKLQGKTVEDTLQTTHSAMESLISTVMSMDAWKTAGSQVGYFWVYDTDGWAYWAAPLLPGETTGLLLDSIKLIAQPPDDWYYSINVVAQFATEEDYTARFDATDASDIAGAASSDALALLDKAKNNIYAQMQPGHIFTDATSGIDWRVLTKDVNGNLLLITENVISYGTQYHSGASFYNYSSYGTGGITAATTMNTWYNAAHAGDLANHDLTWVAANLPVERTTTSTWPSPLTLYSSSWLESLSTAGTAPATAFTSVVFPLSISEVNKYGDKAVGGTGTLNQVAMDIADGNTVRSWWLRSPGPSTSLYSSGIAGDGTITGYQTTDTTHGFRPALWIKP
jgi:hypothetical protein